MLEGSGWKGWKRVELLPALGRAVDRVPHLDARVLGHHVKLLLAQDVLRRLVRVQDAHLVRDRVRVRRRG